MARQCCTAQIMSLSICSGDGGQGHGTLCCCMSSSSGSGGQDHGILYVVHQVHLAMEVKVMVPYMLYIVVLAMEVKGHGTLYVVICQYSLYVSVREGSRRTSCKRKQGHSGHRTALPKSKNY